MPDTSSYRTSKQHPVPQNIMNVEFKLIGELTIKQFGYVAVGAVSAFIAYKSGLYFIWRWLLVFICIGLGVGMAFVPIQDRGLDIWIKSFIKALFSPVIMVWRKAPQYPKFMQVLDEFLAEAPVVSKDTSRYDKKVELTEVLERVSHENSDPLEKRREDFIRSLDFSLEKKDTSPEPPPSAAPLAAPFVSTVAGPSSPPSKKEPFFQVEEVAKKTQREESRQSYEPPVVVRKEPGAPRIKNKPAPKKVVAEKPQPVFETKPNTVHGIVFDKKGKLVDGAVIVIKEPDGDPVRALKSNALGRFQITTSLENGDYLVEVRKDGENFDTIKISLKGEKLPPLEIRAKAS
ncbi:MAG: carboxypeptidase regulatory-like domain-containing protein [bacterium]